MALVHVITLAYFEHSIQFSRIAAYIIMACHHVNMRYVNKQVS